jgi:hypothetical protein
MIDEATFERGYLFLPRALHILEFELRKVQSVFTQRSLSLVRRIVPKNGEGDS